MLDRVFETPSAIPRSSIGAPWCP